jgi:hypothetical protein
VVGFAWCRVVEGSDMRLYGYRVEVWKFTPRDISKILCGLYGSGSGPVSYPPEVSRYDSTSQLLE